MTLRELSRYYKLRERLERSREKLTALTASVGVGAQSLDGMPRSPGVSDKTRDTALAIAELEETVADLARRCDREKRRLERYISAIEDRQTRLIFRLRFVRCMTWPQVAAAVGGGNTVYSVKHICYRYIGKKKT